MPSSASTRSTKSFTAVSGSHIPAGRRPKRWVEVEDPPPHVGADVALVAQREDGVPVGLGDRPAGQAVGVQDPAVHVGVVRLEPRAAAWGRR